MNRAWLYFTFITCAKLMALYQLWYCLLFIELWQLLITIVNQFSPVKKECCLRWDHFGNMIQHIETILGLSERVSEWVQVCLSSHLFLSKCFHSPSFLRLSYLSLTFLERRQEYIGVNFIFHVFEDDNLRMFLSRILTADPTNNP